MRRELARCAKHLCEKGVESRRRPRLYDADGAGESNQRAIAAGVRPVEARVEARRCRANDEVIAPRAVYRQQLVAASVCRDGRLLTDCLEARRDGLKRLSTPEL
jgi:hypothetical protein